MDTVKDAATELVVFATAFESLRNDKRIQLIGMPVLNGLDIRVVDEAVWNATPGKNITVEEVKNFGESDLKPYRVYKEISPGVRIYMNALHYGTKLEPEIKEAA